MGRPVVALRSGGLCETVRPAGNGGDPTGVLYPTAGVDGLLEGLAVFRDCEAEFAPSRLRHHASAFRRDRFVDELRGFAAPGIRTC